MFAFLIDQYYAIPLPESLRLIALCGVVTLFRRILGHSMVFTAICFVPSLAISFGLIPHGGADSAQCAVELGIVISVALLLAATMEVLIRVLFGEGVRYARYQAYSASVVATTFLLQVDTPTSLTSVLAAQQPALKGTMWAALVLGAGGALIRTVRAGAQVAVWLLVAVSLFYLSGEGSDVRSLVASLRPMALPDPITDSFEGVSVATSGPASLLGCVDGEQVAEAVSQLFVEQLSHYDLTLRCVDGFERSVSSTESLELHLQQFSPVVLLISTLPPAAVTEVFMDELDYSALIEYEANVGTFIHLAISYGASPVLFYEPCTRDRCSLADERYREVMYRVAEEYNVPLIDFTSGAFVPDRGTVSSLRDVVSSLTGLLHGRGTG